MSIKRYNITKDSTITNVYNDGLKVRATKSNMGASDSLEIFSLYGRASEEESESSRILVYFPTSQIEEDRTNSVIGTSGSSQFILKLSNVAHRESVPSQFTLTVNPLSRSWSEGIGLDMETYKDAGAVNWLSASEGVKWTNPGGDYYTSPELEKYFTEGTEDLELDITTIVEEWIDGTKPNHGLLIRLSSSIEEGTESYYTKKFSSRGTEYFYSKPWVEARSDSSILDDRARFYSYNQFVPLEDNYNTIYLYNRFKGKLIDIPNFESDEIYVGFYGTDPSVEITTPLTLISGTQEAMTNVVYVSGSRVSTGLYKCDVCINTTKEKIWDVWFDSTKDWATAAGGGTIEIVDPEEILSNTEQEHIYTTKKMKAKYSNAETATVQVFIRNKKWNPNSYTSIAEQDNLSLPEEVYYKIFRVVDGYDVIPYGTGSYKHTRLSRDNDGYYFNFHTNMFEPGYSYGIKFLSNDRGNYIESKETFKFRVE